LPSEEKLDAGNAIVRIAIVGGGISGLTAGYRLSKKFDVTLFEANHYIGGHTNTIEVNTGTDNIAVDTGFIVFNDRTYPNFISLLTELNVDFQKTQMSFSVSCQRTGLEYSGTGLNGLFAQRKNIMSPWFYRLLLDFGRFKKDAYEILGSDGKPESVRDFFNRKKYSKQFVEQYFLPMGAAIWSSSFEAFREFPIQFIAEFYKNHGLLGIRDRPQWYVVKGGSYQYVKPLTESWKENIHVNSPVEWVDRMGGKVSVKVSNRGAIEFDHVIFACHSDQALKILGDGATSTERDVLSAFPYQKNTAILHTDTRLLPSNRRAWACWNYFNPKGHSDSATLTYNMNMLQTLDTEKTYCVTLNDEQRIRPEHMIRSFEYAHPTFSINRNAMQSKHTSLIDENDTSFCGAYWGNGFHEDGVKSALAVVKRLVEVPFEV
jgi:predicted NAD/FAD-binding protein